MKKNSKTRIGIIGMGLMGAGHARCLRDGLIPGAVLAAACDPDRRLAGEFPGVPWFDDVRALVRSGSVMPWLSPRRTTPTPRSASPR